MNKIGKFLKQYKNLTHELMSDKYFVGESKKIFEENRLEFSEDMLEEILEDMENNLREVQDLPDDKLAEVVGGSNIEEESVVSSKKPRTKAQIAGSIAIKVTSTIIGTVVGGAVGYYWLGRKKTTHYDGTGKVTGYDIGHSDMSGFIGGVAGNVIGYRLGALISRKLGLED